MFRRSLIPLFLLTFCLACVSCEKRRTLESLEATLKIETLESLDAIPLSYGELVDVIVHPTEAETAGLWFQKPDKTISVVWVNMARCGMYKRVVVIPRK